jgi:hypothetical protein
MKDRSIGPAAQGQLTAGRGARDYSGIRITAIMMPPFTGMGWITTGCFRPRVPTTVQPLAVPTAAPKTTSLRKCRLSTSRDVAT